MLPRPIILLTHRSWRETLPHGKVWQARPQLVWVWLRQTRPQHGHGPCATITPTVARHWEANLPD